MNDKIPVNVTASGDIRLQRTSSNASLKSRRLSISIVECEEASTVAVAF